MKPLQRADCSTGKRPCEWLECKYHLVHEDRRVNWNWSSLQLAKYVLCMYETCVLDIADQDEELTLRQMGNLMGISYERIRQIEGITERKGKEGAINRLRHPTRSKELIDFVI